jgi:predicted nucleic acid-binding Zn ribbon protein
MLKISVYLVTTVPEEQKIKCSTHVLQVLSAMRQRGKTHVMIFVLPHCIVLMAVFLAPFVLLGSIVLLVLLTIQFFPVLWELMGLILEDT